MKQQDWKALRKRLLTAAALAVLCVNLITLLLDATGLRDTLGWLPYGLHAVETGSMEPAISQGDLILVKRIPYSELSIGDDVTFITTGGFVTHRLVGVQDQRFITQGIANTVADPVTMGPESYCGKVIAAIPGLGQPVKMLESAPGALAVICLLILMLTVGQPLLKTWYNSRFAPEEQAQPAAADLRSRGLVCAMLISLLMSMPTMTEAKYLTRLSRYEMAIAQPVYFSSNYLSSYKEQDQNQTGNVYSIQGWAGNAYILNLDIRNFDNALLYNSDAMPLVYGIAVEPLADSNENYTVSLDTQVSAQAQNIPFPEQWAEFTDKKSYRLEGGTPSRHQFQIVIEPQAGYTAQPNDVVSFAIHACTSKTDNYFKELKGTFHLQVAETKDFLGQIQVTNKTSMVDLSVTTNLIADGSTDGEKLVGFRWDPDKLFLNEYERTAFNAIKDKNGRYVPEDGLLYMRLQAYSKVELTFFKKSSFIAGEDDFIIMVVENVNQIPGVYTPQPDAGSGEENGTTETENNGNDDSGGNDPDENNPDGNDPGEGTA